jgi:hypothetical protein
LKKQRERTGENWKEKYNKIQKIIEKEDIV